MLLGLLLFLAGLALALGAKIPWFGHLPGDISIVRGNARWYFPLASGLLLSLLLSLLLYLLGKFK